MPENLSRTKKNTGDKKNKKTTGKKIFLTILTLILILVGAGAAYGYNIFRDAKNTAKEFYTPSKNSNPDTVKKATEKISDKKPISILILGTDSRDEDLGGRSDTMIVATLNPQHKKTTLVSIARDTYVEGVSLNKINSAYADGGSDRAIEVVDDLLDIKLDHYVTMNFEGLKSLVDAVGGIEVKSNLAFSYDGHSFSEGVNSLNGDEALAYSRMRKEDPRGDYGRQIRQRQVITAVINKLKSPAALTSYKEVLSALGSNMKTDISFDQLIKIAQNYSSAFDNVTSDNLQGDGQMINGLSYQIVSEDELNRVKNLVKGELQ